MRGVIAGVIIALVFIAGIFTAHVFVKNGKPAEDSQTKMAVSPGKDIIKKKFDSQFVKTARLTTIQAPLLVPITGKITFDPENVRLVSARVPGRLNRILQFEGTEVKEGDALAELYAPDYISAQQEYLLSKRTLQAIEKTNDVNLIDDGQATLKAARLRLINLGAWEEDINKLDQTGLIEQYQLIRTPIAGMIVKRNLDQGSYLNIGDNFMMIADLNKLWFLGNVYEQDYSKVKPGQTLILQSPAIPNKKFTCSLSFMAPDIDPVTHVLPVYCILSNSKKDLRPDLFINGELIVGKSKALLAPVSAVIVSKDQKFVIVQIGDDEYQRRLVDAVKLSDSQMAILSGVSPNERVVVEGAVLLNQVFDNL